MKRRLTRAAIIVTVASFAATVTAQEGNATPAAQPLPATDQTWTPEELEALLAPIALYPDPVLTQILLAAKNPQEVLDAGNWLVENPDLEGDALDKAAEAAGFTPPVRAIIPFRQIIDQMCLEMGWTTEVGQAYTNDEASVLAAVQRLRAQAEDVGNLKSSEQMNVETKTQDGQEVIVIEPPSPTVIYVPTYDPVTVYAPPPEPSGGAVAAASVISFGVGLTIGAAMRPYYGPRYYPNYYGGFIPPPPPYYYRPVYGGGYHPSHHYNRSSSYNKVLSDNNVIVVNKGKNKDYWGKFDDKPRGKSKKANVESPITKARPDRADLKNADRAKAKKQDWKGKSTYQGANAKTRERANLPKKGKMPDSKAVRNQAASNASAAKGRKPSGGGDRGYAGKASSAAGSRPAASNRKKQSASSQPSTRPSSRPQRSSSGSSQGRISGRGSGSSARAASSRGRSSMSSRGGGGRGAGAGRRR
jgi:hypothetical protein